MKPINVSKIWFTAIALGIFLGNLPSAVAHENLNSESFTAAGSYNIRSVGGDRLCTVPRGTTLSPNRIDASGDMVQVDLNVVGCPKKGWVSVNGLRHRSSEVAVEGSLALRDQAGGAWSCNLPNGTPLRIDEAMPPTSQYRAWVKVSLNGAPEGCPKEGFVHSEYLTPSSEFLKRLPRNTKNQDEEDAEVEAKANEAKCENCSKKNSLKGVTEKVKRFADISSWPRNRGLVQVPTKGSRGNIGPCGSFHYNPDRSSSGQITDNYANPTTACALMALAQKWKKNFCPNNNRGCRLAWGDISHKTKAKFNGHKTHTDGECIDFRPFRKGEFANAPLTYGSSAYDRNMTRRFIELARSMGGQPIYFNDPRIQCGRAGGHHNHVHICFPARSRKVRSVCNNFQYDAKTCESNSMAGGFL